MSIDCYNRGLQVYDSHAESLNTEESYHAPVSLKGTGKGGRVGKGMVRNKKGVDDQRTRTAQALASASANLGF